MTPEELATRQSLEIIDSAIKELCLRRDQLVSSLPETPRPTRRKTCPVSGMEIKLGGGKRTRRKTA